MKFLFWLFIFSSSFVQAQLVFEVNEPQQIAGVFPCMAAKGASWGSPDLFQNGNWYSDTLIVANDGSIGSSCAVQVSALLGNFALFYRSGCNLSEALINAQNAGATGAIIIDSVSGRPLSFQPDPLSSQVTIPFVIISENTGIQLLYAAVAGETVVVSFGDKTGTHSADVGIHKEYALWSKFGVFPLWMVDFPDYHLGTWVFNHGTTAMNNLIVERWFSLASNAPIETSHVSAPFDLNPGDSVFVAFDWHYTPQSWSIDTLRYGYRLLNVQDEDSLDNAIENFLLVKESIYSNSYVSTMNASAVDYMIPLDDSASAIVQHNLVFRLPFDTLFPAIGCFTSNTFFFDEGISPFEGYLAYFPDSNNWNLNDPYLIWSGSFNFPSAGGVNGSYVQSTGGLDWESSNKFAMINLEYSTNNYGEIGYTSDMYFDELYRQSGFPVFFSKKYNSQTLSFELMPIPEIIIPIHFAEITTGLCGAGLKENRSNATVTLTPNPTDAYFTISASEELEYIQIMDAFGRVIYVEEVPNSIQHQMYPDLLSGTYFVKCTFTSGNQSVVRLLRL